MFVKRRAALACHLLVGLLVVLPACAQKSISRPKAVKKLLVDYTAPDVHDPEFTPVPEEELAAFEMPATEPYRLGVGDVVLVRIISAEPVPGFEGGVQARVAEDGTVRLPRVGKIDARDKTVLELEDALTEPFQTKVVKDALPSVTVAVFEARRFFVVGEVGTPGTMPANGTTTLFEALISAGGTNLETADLEEAYVIRDHKPIPFSIRDIVMRGHPAGRVVLQEHDIVFVPHVKDRTDFVYVFGEVGKQARVPMDHSGRRGTVGKLTLAAALGQVGGLSNRADINSITIYRGGWQMPKEYKIGVQDVYRYGTQIHLRPGDRIAVGTSKSAAFSDAIGPTVELLRGSSSALSLALSIIALND